MMVNECISLIRLAVILFIGFFVFLSKRVNLLIFFLSKIN